MNSVIILSHLLDYPTQALIEHRYDVLNAVDALPLDRTDKEALKDFVRSQTAHDLMDWQSEYDEQFERGRSLSLMLFEHLHGESRDRGQAMVDLLQQYRAAGLDISERELPDYLPLYLEFLSTQGEENFRAGLAEVAHILAVLACRLEQRESPYAAVLHALLSLSGVEVALDDVREQLNGEKRDDTPEAIDKVWEEEQVTFGAGAGGDSCPTAQNKPTESQRRDQYMPLNWVDAAGDPSVTAERGV